MRKTDFESVFSYDSDGPDSTGGWNRTGGMTGYAGGPGTAAPAKKKAFTKDDSAFRPQGGICYTDKKGNAYTYEDLFAFSCDEDCTKHLFDVLSGRTPEETLEYDRDFTKCRRCGSWSYRKMRFFGKQAGSYCRSCTPLRTNGMVPLVKDPYLDDRTFTSKKHAVFRPGLTSLVGCNGAGKTTLINETAEFLKKRGTPFLKFDNLGEEGGENNARGLLSGGLGGYKSHEDMEKGLMLAFASSEGEKIRAAMAEYAGLVAKELERSAGYGEFWFLVDALDSGLSVDMIEDIKEYLFRPLMKAVPEDTDLYIVISSNSYEMSESTECFSLEKMDYIPVRGYEAFKKAVLSSRRCKEKRDDVFAKKAEIAGRKYTFTADKRLLEAARDNTEASGEVLSMELAPYRLVMNLKMKQWNGRLTPALYIRDGGDWKKRKCGYEEETGADLDIFGLSGINEKKMEEKMHSWLVRQVFLYERKKKK